MGASRILGADNGSGHTPWSWNYSNKSANLRYGALVALSLVSGADPMDIVLPYEVQGGVVVGGAIVGVNTKAGAEATLTTPLAVDGTGVQSMSIASGSGRAQFILSPDQTLTAQQPFLIPDPANPGNVIVMPIGSGVPPVARALSYPAPSSAEQYVEAEFMPGLSAGLDANPGQLVMAEAVDALVSARYIPTTGNHTNPAAAVNTPVVYRARTQTRIFAMQANLATATGGGAGDGVRYRFKVGATPQAAAAATASSFIELTAANLSAAPAGGASDPTSFLMPAGTVLVIDTLGIGAGVGTGVHSMISFRAQ